MNKIFLFFFVAMLCGSTALFAQFQFGPSAGLNVANMSAVGDSIEGFNNELGFRLGGTGLASINPQYFHIQLGGYFDQLRFSYTEEGSSEYTLYYFSVPFNLVGSYPINDDLLIMLKAGPTISIGLFGNEENANGENREVVFGSLTDNDFDSQLIDTEFFITPKDEEAKTVFNRFNASLNVGLQGMFYKRFLVHADYTLGLSNVIAPFSGSDADIEAVYDDQREAQSFRTGMYSFGISYLLFPQLELKEKEIKGIFED